MILDTNVVKNRKNKTISDLNIGDKVRKNLLFNDKNSNVFDPKWSGKVFSVVKIYGNTIALFQIQANAFIKGIGRCKGLRRECHYTG